MIPREELLATVRQCLADEGFKGRGRNLRAGSPEVAWLVQLELVPRSSRVGIDVGICPALLAPGGWPGRASNCPIVIDPASGGAALFGHDDRAAWEALDVGSDLADAERRHVVAQLAGAIASTARRLATLEQLEDAVRRGEVGGFMRHDARQLLLGGA
jgi:hypothetical protein